MSKNPKSDTLGFRIFFLLPSRFSFFLPYRLRSPLARNRRQRLSPEYNPRMSTKTRVSAFLIAAVAAGCAGALVGQMPEAKQLPPSAPKDSTLVIGGEHQAKNGKVETTGADLYGDPLPPGALARMGTVRLRGDHSRYISFSEDGKTLLTAGDGPAIRSWDVATGKQIQKKELKQIEPPWQLVSPDGKLVVNEQNKQFVVWEVVTAKELAHIPMPEHQVIRMALSPDARTLALQTYDIKSHSVSLWDVATGKERCQLSGHKIFSSSLLFSPDGKILATASNDGKVRFWDSITGNELQQIKEPGTTLTFSRDGKTLATAGKIVRLWDVPNGQARATLSGNGVGYIYSLAFTPNDTQLAAGTQEEIILWDLATRKLVRRWASRGNYRLTFSPDGRTLVSLGGRGMRLWDVASGRPLHSYPGHQGDVASIAFSPDGKLLVSNSWDEKTLRLWETTTGELLRVFPGHENYARTVVFSPDGNSILSGGGDGTLRLWETATGKELRKFPIQAVNPEDGKPHVKSVRFSADGQRVTASSMAGDTIPHFQVDTLNIATGDLITHQTSRRDPSCLTSDGGAFITGAPDGLVVQDTATGRELLRIPEKLWDPSAFSPDRRILAASICGPPPPGWMGRGDVEALTLWETAAGRFCLRIQTGPFAQLTFSPDGRLLATAGREAITIFEVAAGKECLRIPCPEKYRSVFGDSFVSCAAFSPNSRKLATGLADTTILVWDLTPGVNRAELAKLDVDSKKLEKWWTDLAGEDGQAAYRAIWDMAAIPEKSTPFLSGRLKPVELDSKRIGQLIADLDNTEFRVRDAAAQELARFGEEVEPRLRQALAKKPSAEVRKRLEALLTAPRPIPTGETLRALRAIQVLEYIGTPEAHRVLKSLADGASHARVTREAKAALQRFAPRLR
jgi:WD40 repeat protein